MGTRDQHSQIRAADTRRKTSITRKKRTMSPTISNHHPNKVKDEDHRLRASVLRSSDRIREADQQVEEMNRRPTHNKDVVRRDHQVCPQVLIFPCGEDGMLHVYMTTSRTNYCQQAWIVHSFNQHHPRLLLMTTPFRLSQRRSRSKVARNLSTRAWHK